MEMTIADHMDRGRILLQQMDLKNPIGPFYWKQRCYFITMKLTSQIKEMKLLHSFPCFSLLKMCQINSPTEERICNWKLPYSLLQGSARSRQCILLRGTRFAFFSKMSLIAGRRLYSAIKLYLSPQKPKVARRKQHFSEHFSKHFWTHQRFI